MKALISVFLVFSMLLMLCACGKEGPETTPNTTAAPTTASTAPVHTHSFRDADCTTPKTCTDCGQTRGDALGHDYSQNICTRCGYEDQTYISLTDGNWQMDSLADNEINLAYISLTFQDDGTAEMLVQTYISMDSIPEELWDNYPEEFLYDYSGTIFVFTGSYTKLDLEYTVNGNEITCSTLSGAQTDCTFTLERISSNQLCLVFFEGNPNVIYWQVGDILRGNNA